MLTLIKVSPQRYMLIQAPTVGGYYGFTPADLQPDSTGFEMANVSAPILVGSYAACLERARFLARDRKLSITHEAWKRKVNSPPRPVK